MRNIFLVSKYTFLEAVKSKILLNTVFIGIGMVFVTWLAVSLTYGAEAKISVDFSFGLMSISMKMISVFYGVGILFSEIENRTTYMILSRPIGRSEFLLGKFFGMSGILFLNLLILCIFMVSALLLTEGWVESFMIWILVTTFLESLLLLALVMLFSLITNKILAILFSISTFVCGYAVTSLEELSVVKQSLSLSRFVTVLEHLLPNFSKLNLKNYFTYNQQVDTTVLYSIVAYSVGYIVALLVISSLVFERKSLD